MVLSERLFSFISNLVSSIIKEDLKTKIKSWTDQKKVRLRLEESILKAVESLSDFLRNEKLNDDQRELLVKTCESELRPLLDDPSKFFAASLEGTKLFIQLHPENRLPQAIEDEKVGHPYRLLFERVAALICAYGPALKLWETEGQQEVFRRFDQIAERFIKMSRNVDELSSRVFEFIDAPAQSADRLLRHIRRSRLQNIELKIELTSLANERPEKGNFDDLFVLPSLMLQLDSLEYGGSFQAFLDIQFISGTGEFGHRSVVNGPPGAGKSTWAFWLQRQLFQSTDTHFPLLIPLRQIAQRDDLPTDLDLVHEAINKFDHNEVTSEVLHRWKTMGLLTFIFDGFDEIPLSRRDEICDWLLKLSAHLVHLGSSRIVVTSRPLTTDHLRDLDGNWKQWEILAFDQPRVREYIERWYKSAPLISEADRQVDAETLARTWTDDPVLGHLTGNPLLLSTLLMVDYMEGHKLPEGRTELYTRYIDGMLGKWDDRRKVPAGSITLTRAEKYAILIRIALHFHLTSQDQLPEEKLLEEIARILIDPDVHCERHKPSEVLSYLRERTGLLVGPGTYTWVHKSVGEFFVAEAIRKGNLRDSAGHLLDRRRLFNERHDDRWNTVIFFWAGLAAPVDVEEFIQDVVSRQSLDGRDSTNEKLREALLAIGIMHDRVKHISQACLRTQLPEALKYWIGNTDNESDGIFVFTNEPVPADFAAKIVIPNPWIRSVRKIDLVEAFRELLFNTGFGYGDLQESCRNARLSAWFFALETDDIETWCRTVTEDVPNFLPEHWPTIALVYSLERMATSSMSLARAEEFLAHFRSKFPKYAGAVPFLLLGQAVGVGPFYSSDSVWSKDDLPVLKLILLQRQTQHDDKWLMGTASTWTTGNQPKDLLKLSDEQLTKAAESNQLSDSATITDLRSYIAELHNARTGLLAGQ